jgi:hypothetical protein
MKREDLGKAQTIINQLRELELWKETLQAENPDISIVIHYRNMRATVKNGCIISELGVGLVKAPSEQIEIDFLHGFQERIQAEFERLEKELSEI